MRFRKNRPQLLPPFVEPVYGGFKDPFENIAIDAAALLAPFGHGSEAQGTIPGAIRHIAQAKRPTIARFFIVDVLSPTYAAESTLATTPEAAVLQYADLLVPARVIEVCDAVIDEYSVALGGHVELLRRVKKDREAAIKLGQTMIDGYIEELYAASVPNQSDRVHAEFNNWKQSLPIT